MLGGGGYDYQGQVQGYNITVGGGLGRTHRDEDTMVRLADPLGYVDKDDIVHAVKAIVATQRDYGRRDNRRQARLKYLVHEWGVKKFRYGMAYMLGVWARSRFRHGRACILAVWAGSSCLEHAGWALNKITISTQCY